MSNLVGDNYGDSHSEEEAPHQQGTAPGEGKNDQPATTGTHRGWGDPQPDEVEDKDAES